MTRQPFRLIRGRRPRAGGLIAFARPRCAARRRRRAGEAGAGEAGAGRPRRAKPWLPENQGPTSERTYKVHLDFNRWHDVAELIADLKTLEKAWPKFLKYSSIGKTFDGRDILLMTINNPDTGPELSKAAMYIEANVHGNEIQGGEICLYTIWYLMENYGEARPDHQARQRARLLHPAHRQPRRPRLLHARPRRQRPQRPLPGGR